MYYVCFLCIVSVCMLTHTWSCLPQMTCKGVVICCICSCKAYFEFSLIISMKTVVVYRDNTLGKVQLCKTTLLLHVAYIHTDPHDKSHCVESVHPPGLEESINKSKRHTWCVKVCSESRVILHDMCVTNLLRHSEAHVRTELQHLLHLLRGGWNKRNIQCVLAVLHIMHLTVKLGLVLVLQTFREKCDHAGVMLQSIFCLSV